MVCNVDSVEHVLLVDLEWLDEDFVAIREILMDEATWLAEV